MRCLLTLLLSFAFFAANAANYTAINTGNYTASTTWQGGTIPPVNIANGDLVTIKTGVAVTMDKNIVMNNGGTLHLESGSSLVINNNSIIHIQKGSVSGTGTISIDSLYIGRSCSLSFVGNITANTLAFDSAFVNTNIAFNVNKKVILTGGITDMVDGSLNLSAVTPVTIERVSGGINRSGNATIPLINRYHVKYYYDCVAGPELSGSGLGEVELEFPSLQFGDVRLQADVVLKDKLIANKWGRLHLNGYDLTFDANSTAVAANLISTSTSNIYVRTSGYAGEFSLAGKVNKLVIDINDSSQWVWIRNEFDLIDSLILKNGIMQGDVKLAKGAVIQGGSTNSYVSGMVRYRLAPAQREVLPIGNRSAGFYAPMRITNTSTVDGDVIGNVRLDITEGATSLSTQYACVAQTWYLLVSNSPKVDVEVMWDNTNAVNGFEDTACYIATRGYYATKWMHNTPGKASQINGYSSLKLTDIDSSINMAVFGVKPVSLAEQFVVGNNVLMYPNPVTNKLTIIYNESKATQAPVYNNTGQLVKKVLLRNGKQEIDVSDLPKGNYILMLDDKPHRFVKL